MSETDEGFRIAVEQMQQSMREGGLPVGSAIVGADGTILGRGRNTRVQNGSPILHAETAAFDSNRDLPISSFAGSTIYTTLSPCMMCFGAMVLFKVKRVVIGDSKHMSGREPLLREHGIEVVELHSKVCEDELQRYIETSPRGFPID